MKNLRSTGSSQKTMESVLRKYKRVYGGNDLWTRWVLIQEWQKEGVKDNKRGDAVEKVETMEVEWEREEVEWCWRSIIVT